MSDDFEVRWPEADADGSGPAPRVSSRRHGRREPAAAATDDATTSEPAVQPHGDPWAKATAAADDERASYGSRGDRAHERSDRGPLRFSVRLRRRR